MGKTSLLARGLQQGRESGLNAVSTDLQKFNAESFLTVDRFYQAMGESMADQLNLAVTPAEEWDPRRGPNANFERYVRREVLAKTAAPLAWGLDEVDRLFVTPFGTEVFGLLRSWHNERALDPTGPWSSLTTAIAYATEAHLFITDLNQSPFNIGTRLGLEDFTALQVAELNRRYRSPLKSQDELTRFYRLAGGHPYLVRRGLYEMSTRKIAFRQLRGAGAAGRGLVRGSPAADAGAAGARCLAGRGDAGCFEQPALPHDREFRPPAKRRAGRRAHP